MFSLLTVEGSAGSFEKYNQEKDLGAMAWFVAAFVFFLVVSFFISGRRKRK